MNISSDLDMVYYEKKYNLEFRNKKEATEHYRQIGRERGFFPNRETEIYYCRSINFDPDYYRSKYMTKNNIADIPLIHWKAHGYILGYNVNACEENGYHFKTCKCSIKTNSAYKKHDDFDAHIGIDLLEVNNVNDIVISNNKINNLMNINNRSTISNEINDANATNETIKTINTRELDGQAKSIDENNIKLNDEIIMNDNNSTYSDVLDTDITNTSNIFIKSNISNVNEVNNDVNTSSKSMINNFKNNLTAKNNRNNVTRQMHNMHDMDESNDTIDTDDTNYTNYTDNTDDTIYTDNTDDIIDSDELKYVVDNVENIKNINNDNLDIVNNKMKNNDENKKITTKKIDNYDLLRGMFNLFNQTNGNIIPTIFPSTTLPSTTLSTNQKALDTTQITQTIQKSLDNLIKNKNDQKNENDENDENDENNKNDENKMDMIKNEEVMNDDKGVINIDIDVEFDLNSFEKEYVENLSTFDLQTDIDYLTTYDNDNTHDDATIYEHNDHDIFYTIYDNDDGDNINNKNIIDSVMNSFVYSDNANDKNKEKKKKDSKKKDKKKKDDKETIDDYVYDKNIKNIKNNIQCIKQYIEKCDIYLDSYTEIIKKSYECITELSDMSKTNDYKKYNIVRLRLYNLLMEGNLMITSSKCNNMPIFYDDTIITQPHKTINAHKHSKHSKHRDNKECKIYKTPSHIKFPMITCANDEINKMMNDMHGGKYAYFKMELMKVSLKNLGLFYYALKPLNKGVMMTNRTNPIPPLNCPIGMTPKMNYYNDDKLKINWYGMHHVKVFERALYKLSMAKENLSGYIKILDMKEELFIRICSK
jgi:hypothetical protein